MEPTDNSKVGLMIQANMGLKVILNIHESKYSMLIYLYRYLIFIFFIFLSFLTLKITDPFFELTFVFEDFMSLHGFNKWMNTLCE